MRKVITSAVAAAALAAIPIALTPTAALADTNASQICSQYNDLGFSHGACVDLLNSNQNNAAIFVSVCQQIQQDFPAAFAARFKNLGECVTFLVHQPKPTPTPSPTVSPSTTPSPIPTPLPTPKA